MKTISTKRIISLLVALTVIISSMALVTVVSATADLSTDFVKTYTESTSSAQASDSLIRTKAGEDTAYMLRNSNDINGRNSAFVNTDGADYNTTLFDGSTGNSMRVAKHASASSDTTDTSAAVFGTSLVTAEASGATPRTWFDKSSLSAGDTLIVSAYAKTVEADKTAKFNLVLSKWNSVSTTVYTNEYGTAGMGVTNDWTKFLGVITVPADFTTTDAYTLHFGFAQNTKMENMNVSCIYAAKAAPVDIKTTLSKAVVNPGESFTARAEILNQANTTDGIAQDVTWYITNEDRTAVVSEGFSIGEDGVITVSSSAAKGNYYAVAVSNANEAMVSGKAFEVKQGAVDVSTDFSSGITLQTTAKKGSDSLIMTLAGQDAAYMLRNANDINGRDSAFVNADGADYGTTLYDGSTGNSIKLAKHASASSDTTDASMAVHGTSLTTSEPSSVPRAWFDKSGLKPGDKLLVSAYARTRAADAKTKFNIALTNLNSASKVAYTEEYGSAGMEVSNEWTKFVGIITVPADFTTTDDYTLHFGYAQNTKMESMNISCLYAAKVKPATMTLDLANSSVVPGGSTTAVAELLNQAGTKSGVDNNLTWYVTNSARTEILEDSGITVASGENGTASISVSDTTAVGTYYIVAANADFNLMGKPLTVTAPTEYTVNFTKSGNGVVSYEKEDGSSYTFVSGANTVEAGTKSFTFTPDEGNEIASVTYGGSSIPVANKDSFTVSLNVNSAKDLTVVFTEKLIVKPSVLAGETIAVKNYDYSHIVPGAPTSNAITLFSSIEVGFGYTISECGCILTNKDGDSIELPAFAVPENGKYGVRAVGAAIESGTYTVKPYLKLSDDSIVYGTEKSVTVE